MAGRIRSIKPEILDDEKTAGLDHLSWRLFVSIWLIADDYGNLRADPGYIQGQILWASRDSRESVANSLRTLATVDLVTAYGVRGQSYIHINGWDKHQRVDKPGKPRMPGPDEADSSTCANSRESRESGANDSRESRESLAPDLRPPTTTGTTTGTPSNEPGQPALVLVPVTPAKRDPVADIWAEQERQRSAAIPGSRPLSLTSDRRKRVQGLLDAGHTEADLLAVIGEYAREARSNGGEWFNGDTNWRPDNVTRTLGRIGSQPSRSGALTGMAAFHELMRERGES